MAALTRRRFIQLAAVAGASAMTPLSAWASALPVARWHGVALGAEAQLTLAHPDRHKAQRAITQCLAEINRLEDIFSLYRAHSAINRLNRQGHLDAPPAELVEVITTAMQYGQRSDGVFDITIQPVWQAYHEHFKQGGADPAGPPDALIQQALALVDYRKIAVSAKRITLQPGMAITLNGIAQGYITDRIASLLAQEGFAQALINLGEYQALGQHPTGRSWRVGLPNPDAPWQLVDSLDIPAGTALATSGAYGTRWSAQAHHLLSAKTGLPVAAPRAVSVLAANAMQADALATLLALQQTASPQQYPEALQIVWL